jgi:hypothetical protein
MGLNSSTVTVREGVSGYMGANFIRTLTHPPYHHRHLYVMMTL